MTPDPHPTDAATGVDTPRNALIEQYLAERTNLMPQDLQAARRFANQASNTIMADPTCRSILFPVGVGKRRARVVEASLCALAHVATTVAQRDHPVPTAADVEAAIAAVPPGDLERAAREVQVTGELLRDRMDAFPAQDEAERDAYALIAGAIACTLNDAGEFLPDMTPVRRGAVLTYALESLLLACRAAEQIARAHEAEGPTP